MNVENGGPKRPDVASAFAGARAALSRLLSASWLRNPRVIAAALVLGGLVCAAIGYAIARSPLPHAMRVSVLDPAAVTMRRWLGQRDQAHWERYETHLGPFQVVRARIADEADGAMAALEELDGHLVFLTQRGAMSVLTEANELHALAISPPMNNDALRAANLPGLNYDFFRALDLLAIQTAPSQFDLYVSYNKFVAADSCFQIAVGRIGMSVDDGGVTPASDWEEVFTTQPCVPPRVTPDVFIGLQSGGRLVRYDERTILFSTGDLEFDGVLYPGMEEAPNGPQDPSWDLGKIIALDIESGRATHWARGFRNPQGLHLDRQGRLWETEHGPYGGDEINLVRRGGNYGWPNVTYGMRYNPLYDNWPLNPTHGGHEGYDRPAHVFVPAIGVSQLIQPSEEAFPFWRSSLLVLSMRARALYAARLDGDEIVYAEPLPMGARLRDIINRRDGEIAIVTDGGALIRIRPIENGEVSSEPFAIADLRHGDRRERLSPAQAGQRVFAANCASCHSLAGATGAGPPLNGVVGRDIAATDYPFSPALEAADGAWTAQRLTSFLTEPEPRLSGTTMPAPQLTREQARQIVAYLRTTDD